jgi:hypothetical protein
MVYFKVRLHTEDVKTRALVSGLLAMLLAVSMPGFCSGGPTAEPCVPIVVGVDTSKTTSSNSPQFGEAFGQVFLARDTLIQSITVWRASVVDTGFFSLRLYIAETDSLGRPAPNSVISVGPDVFNEFGDGVHHIPFRFEFDPPFALPGPGKYEFAIQPVPCDGRFEALFDNKNSSYADGGMWLHGRSAITGCRLRNYPSDRTHLDLIFEIEFCDTSTVPVLPQSWGRVKESYR